MTGDRPLSAIFGCEGARLSDRERDFFRDADPLGFILFQRNCEDPDQIRALTAELRATVGRHAPILIDEEGGRVRRLKPPHWPEHPAAARIGRLSKMAVATAAYAAALHAHAIAAMLMPLGIDHNAAPCLDLGLPSESDVIGDRAFSGDPAIVAELGGAAYGGSVSCGLMPIVKHLPGHGRAQVDSHKALPVVTTDWDTLDATDFVPFRALADACWGMTCHVVFTAIDPDRPATLSPDVIQRAIRGAIGFKGILVSDDLSMNALTGTLGERAAGAVAAGCDVALHCNGVFDEMVDVAGSVPRISDATVENLERESLALGPRSWRPGRTLPQSDPAAILEELEAFLNLV